LGSFLPRMAGKTNPIKKVFALARLWLRRKRADPRRGASDVIDV
jgi:hypothetical protein